MAVWCVSRMFLRELILSENEWKPWTPSTHHVILSLYPYQGGFRFFPIGMDPF